MKDNSGSLFKNERKDSDRHPDATGKALIDGKMYRVSAWTKVGAKGRFQSLSFTPMEEAAARASITERATAKIRKPDPISSGLPPKQSIMPSDMDDEIPF